MRLAHTPILVDTVSLLYQCLFDIFPGAIPIPSNYPTPSLPYNIHPYYNLHCGAQRLPPPVSDLVCFLPTLAVDLEGTNLSRNGTVSLIQIMRVGSTKVWLIDVTVMRQQAFEITDHRGINLRGILQHAGIVKLLFDVRNDSDALYNCHGVLLSGVYDLQLLEVAVRLSNARRARLLAGLHRCITQYLSPPSTWSDVKLSGKKLFRIEDGGSPDIFDRRPLDPLLIEYSSQDVTLLPFLKVIMVASLGGVGLNWEQRVWKESDKRVSLALDRNYQPNGSDKILAPKKM